MAVISSKERCARLTHPTDLSLSDVHDRQGWSSLKAGARNPIWVSLVGSRGLGIPAVFHSFPRCNSRELGRRQSGQTQTGVLICDKNILGVVECTGKTM